MEDMVPSTIAGSHERIEMYRLTATVLTRCSRNSVILQEEEARESLLGHQSPELAVQLYCMASVVYNVL